MVVLGGGAVSEERGTPVARCVITSRADEDAFRRVASLPAGEEHADAAEAGREGGAGAGAQGGSQRGSIGGAQGGSHDEEEQAQVPSPSPSALSPRVSHPTPDALSGYGVSSTTDRVW